MQNKLHKEIYSEFVYSDPSDHLLKKYNNLTRPKHNCKRVCKEHFHQVYHSEIPNANPNPNAKPSNVINIQGDIGNNNILTQTINTSHDVQTITQTTNDEAQNKVVKEAKPIPIQQNNEKVIYSEEIFNQIELRGFITKDLLKQSLDRGSNLFHIQQNIFERLLDRYNQFKEILHTLETEFDNTVECIIETGKELTKKISHIIYELYLAVMNRVQD